MKSTVHSRALALGATIVAAVAAHAGPTTTVIDRPGSGSNRIEVTGNSASRVSASCAEGAGPGERNVAANVNSVNIDGRALQGRTVIVTGRNSRDEHVRSDCGTVQGGAASVNSINIR